ncbi:aldo/keto reductase [Kineobactrum sediminis]|uniref:Aldo/keto reductase n=1 Tax=Kineobactrum sediminis TaxID=1905677 RepID=A0A2N5Y5M2_9GAMM|nr:aldo/keto reductase [Kineobactrum sediminis]PLW83687.1 aldo/keto reductase [Kineobactrum sediminis]
MVTRRHILQVLAALAASRGLVATAAANPATAMTTTRANTRPIPSTGEHLPVIGMGTSRTFDEPASPEILAQLKEVMEAFFEGGGKVIDSSPMYGKAESRVGDILRQLTPRPPVFAATKVWTTGREEGIEQMQASAERMAVEPLDLIAIHNLKDWRTHLATLKAWKAEGRVRYIGITTSHGRYHSELLDIMRREPLDFVQFSYNMEDRVAERALLPVAQDQGIATMINRPYQRGALFAKSRGKALPMVARELGCTSWGQFYLKWILGHPAVTCLIPATSKVSHMRDNMQANTGPVPDTTQRAEMLRVFANL